MTNIPTSGPLDWGSPIPGRAAGNNPGAVRDSALEFEAMLIGRMMRAVREASDGWLGSGEDQTSASMAEFAEQHLARVLSAAGGLGLAAVIERGLTGEAQPRTLSEPAPAKPASP